MQLVLDFLSVDLVIGGGRVDYFRLTVFGVNSRSLVYLAYGPTVGWLLDLLWFHLT